jgi:hypothetical protein
MARGTSPSFYSEFSDLDTVWRGAIPVSKKGCSSGLFLGVQQQGTLRQTARIIMGKRSRILVYNK